MSVAAKVRGANTRAEISSQPQCWNACFEALEAGGQVKNLAAKVRPGADCLFIGCGSSYYISLAAAASWQLITGTTARAVPASELLLYPDLVLNSHHACQPILVSRWGILPRWCAPPNIWKGSATSARWASVAASINPSIKRRAPRFTFCPPMRKAW